MPGKPLNPIIWPLRSISSGDIPALQFALRPKRMFQPVFMQQRPRSVGRRLAPEIPVNRPWNVVSSRFNITDIRTENFVNFPSVVHQLLPMQATKWRISGVTKDSTGTVLPTCVVDVFLTSSDVIQGTTTSNGNGEYLIEVPTQTNHYAVAYKVNSPDLAGTTRNDLSPT